MFDAYGIYRAVMRDPRLPSIASERFNNRKDLAKDALLRLVGDSRMAENIGNEPKLRGCCKSCRGVAKTARATSQSTLSLKNIHPAVAEFQQAADWLAARLTSPDDAVLTALAADFRHQATELHLSLYDDGPTLQLIPALDTGALEENRLPNDDASPWLSFQTLMFGSDALLKTYPQPELRAVARRLPTRKPPTSIASPSIGPCGPPPQ